MPRGAKIVADPDHAAPNPMLGHVTSWCFSPNLDAWIALALVADGRARHGETLWAVSPLADARARVQRRTALLHRSATGSGFVSDRSIVVGSRRSPAAWNVQGDPSRAAFTDEVSRQLSVSRCPCRRTRRSAAND